MSSAFHVSGSVGAWHEEEEEATGGQHSRSQLQSQSMSSLRRNCVVFLGERPNAKTVLCMVVLVGSGPKAGGQV